MYHQCIMQSECVHLPSGDAIHFPSSISTININGQCNSNLPVTLRSSVLFNTSSPVLAPDSINLFGRHRVHHSLRRWGRRWYTKSVAIRQEHLYLVSIYVEHKIWYIQIWDDMQHVVAQLTILHSSCIASKSMQQSNGRVFGGNFCFSKVGLLLLLSKLGVV